MDYSENIIDLSCSAYYISGRQETSGILPVNSRSDTGNSVDVETVENMELPIERQNDRAEPIRVADPQEKISEFDERDTVVKTTAPTGNSGSPEQIVEADRQVGSQNDQAGILKEVEPQGTVLELTQKGHVERGLSSSAVKFVEETSLSTSVTSTRADYQIGRLEKKQAFASLGKGNSLGEKAFVNTLETKKADTRSQMVKSVGRVQSSSETLKPTESTCVEVHSIVGSVSRSVDMATKPGRQSPQTGAIEEAGHTCEVLKLIEAGNAGHMIVDNKVYNQNEQAEINNEVQRVSEVSSTTSNRHEVNTASVDVENESYEANVSSCTREGFLLDAYEGMHQAGTVEDVQFASELADYERDFLAKLATLDIATSRFVEKYFVSFREVGPPLELSEIIGDDLIEEIPVPAVSKGRAAQVFESSAAAALVHEARATAKNVAALKTASCQNGPNRPVEAVELVGEAATSSAVKNSPVFSTAESSDSAEESAPLSCKCTQKCIPAHIAMKIAEYKQLPLEMITNKHIKQLKKWHIMTNAKNKAQNTQKVEHLSIINRSCKNSDSSENILKGSQTVFRSPFIPEFVLEKLAALEQLPMDMITEDQKKAMRKWQKLVKRKKRIEKRDMIRQMTSQSIKRSCDEEAESVKHDSKKIRLEVCVPLTPSSSEMSEVANTMSKLPVREHRENVALEDAFNNIARLKRYAKLSRKQKKLLNELQKFVDAASKSENSYQMAKLDMKQSKIGSVNISEQASEESGCYMYKREKSAARNFKNGAKNNCERDPHSSFLTKADDAPLPARKFRQNKSNLTADAPISVRNSPDPLSTKAASIEATSCVKNIKSTENKCSTSLAGTSGLVQEEAHSPCKPVGKFMPTHIAIKIEKYKQLPLEMITRHHIQRIKRWHKKMETCNKVPNTQEIKNPGTNRSQGKEESSGRVSPKPQVFGVPFIPAFIFEKLETLKQLPIDVITEDQRKALDRWQKLIDRKNLLENVHMERIQQISQSMKRPHAVDSESEKHVSKKPRTQVNVPTTSTSVEKTGVLAETSKLPVTGHPEICGLEDIQKKLDKLKRCRHLSKNQKKTMKKMQELVNATYTMQNSKLSQIQTKIRSASISVQASNGLSPSMCKTSLSTVSKHSSFPGRSATAALPAGKTTSLSINISNPTADAIISSERSPATVSTKPAVQAETYSHVSFVKAAGPLKKLNSCIEKMSNPIEDTFTADVSTPVGTSAVSVSAESADPYSQFSSVKAADSLQGLGSCVENILEPAGDQSTEDECSSSKTSAVSAKPANAPSQLSCTKTTEPLQDPGKLIDYIPNATEDASFPVETTAKPADTYFQPGVPMAARLLQELGSSIYNISKHAANKSTEDICDASDGSRDTYSQIGSVNTVEPLQELDDCMGNISKPAKGTSAENTSSSRATLSTCVSSKLEETHSQANSSEPARSLQELGDCIKKISKPEEGASREAASISVETSATCVSVKSANTYLQAGSSKAAGSPLVSGSCIENILKPTEYTSTEGGSCIGSSPVSVSTKPTDTYSQLGPTTAAQPLQVVGDFIDRITKHTEDDRMCTSTEYARSSVETSAICVSAKPVDTYPQPRVTKLTEDTFTEDAGSSVRTSAEFVSVKSADTCSQVSFVKTAGPVQDPNTCIEDISKSTKDTVTADVTSSVGTLTVSVSAKPTDIYSHFTPLIVTESFRDLNSCVENSSKFEKTKSVEDASACAQTSAAPSFSELAAKHDQFCFAKEIEPLQGMSSYIENISKAAQNKFGDKVCVKDWPTYIEQGSVNPGGVLQKATISRENISMLPEYKSGKVSDSSVETSVVPVSTGQPDVLSQLSFVEAARQLQAVRSSADAINSTNSKLNDDAKNSKEPSVSAKPLVVSDGMVKTAVPLREITTCAEKSIMSKSTETLTNSETKLNKKVAEKKAPASDVDRHGADQMHVQKENQGRKRRHGEDNDGPGEIKRQRKKAPLSPFRVAVVDKEYPEVILTRNQSDAIENELAERLEKAARFGGSVALQFSNCSYAGGVLWICCENQRTKDWLKRNIERLTSFWRGIRLKAVDEADLPLRPKVMVFVPEQEPDLREFRACLDRENPGLTASNWHLIGKKSEENGGIIFAFSIDNNSYAMLENNDWEVSYKHATIRCKVLNKISDMWEDTSEPQNAATTSAKLKHTREGEDKGYPLSWRNAHLKEARKNKRYGRYRSSSQSVYVPYIGFLKF